LWDLILPKHFDVSIGKTLEMACLEALVASKDFAKLAYHDEFFLKSFWSLML
jgi:hypothetical protein